MGLWNKVNAGKNITRVTDEKFIPAHILPKKI
jgi:hypothetical protein